MRFSLRTLLLSVAVVWSAMAAFGVVGLVLALMGLVTAAAVSFRRAASMEQRPLANMFLEIVCVIWGVGFLWILRPVYGHAGPAAREARCSSNLKEIALALHTYHEAYGSLPPAYVPDASGKPMHSWRVLILPYVEEMGLYQQYNFNEPWNGPNNRKLAGQIPYVYRCPSIGPQAGSPTNYMAVVGPRTAWPGAVPTRIRDFRDDTLETIMVVEVNNPNVNWMEPVDLSWDEAVAGVHTKPGAGIGSEHAYRFDPFVRPVGWAHFASVAGSVHRLPENVSSEVIQSLLTISGWEDIPDSALEPPRRPDQQRRAGLIALIVSVTLLILWRNRRERRPPSEAEHDFIPGGVDDSAE
ncbi:MAG: DUF1559 family PulG-like putative transporter [Planctomycetota bacterium]|jgi:hypothetical protein